MNKPLDVHPLAIKEARKAFRWYARRSYRVALRFQELFKKALGDIEAEPQRWPLYLHGTRVLQVRKFPYLIVYRELVTSVLVVAVAHGHRRPDYWKRRK